MRETGDGKRERRDGWAEDGLRRNKRRRAVREGQVEVDNRVRTIIDGVIAVYTRNYY